MKSSSSGILFSKCLQALTQCQTNEKSPSPPQLNAYFSSYPADREEKQKRLTCFNWRKECPMTQAFACSGFGDKNWLGDSEVLNQSLFDLALSFQVVLERGNGKAKNQADWMKANNFIASQPECLLPAPNLYDFISCALFTLFLLIHWSKTTLAWKDSWINKVLQLKTERSFCNARPISFIATKDEFDPLVLLYGFFFYLVESLV